MLIGLFWTFFSTVDFSLNEQSPRTILTKYLTTQGFQSQNANLFFQQEKEKKIRIKRVKMIIFKLRHILLQTNTRQSLCKWLLLFLS